MSYKIEISPNFKKEAKRFNKKYRSLKKDLKELFESLAQNPTQGTPLGHHVYKIRLAIRSKGKGKSGGARVISYVFVKNQTVLLLSTYDKSNKVTISDKEIKALIKRFT